MAANQESAQIKRIPVAQVKAYMRGVPNQELPQLLTEAIRLCMAAKALGDRSVAQFAADMEASLKGL